MGRLPLKSAVHTRPLRMRSSSMAPTIPWVPSPHFAPTQTSECCFGVAYLFTSYSCEPVVLESAVDTPTPSTYSVILEYATYVDPLGLGL